MYPICFFDITRNSPREGAQVEEGLFTFHSSKTEWTKIVDIEDNAFILSLGTWNKHSRRYFSFIIGSQQQRIVDWIDQDEVFSSCSLRGKLNSLGKFDANFFLCWAVLRPYWCDDGITQRRRKAYLNVCMMDPLSKHHRWRRFPPHWSNIVDFLCSRVASYSSSCVVFCK
jgi:hypothetical protein